MLIHQTGSRLMTKLAEHPDWQIADKISKKLDADLTSEIRYFFSQRVIDDWNALPTDVKTQTTVNGFKKRLDAELKSRQ